MRFSENTRSLRSLRGISMPMLVTNFVHGSPPLVYRTHPVVRSPDPADGDAGGRGVHSIARVSHRARGRTHHARLRRSGTPTPTELRSLGRGASRPLEGTERAVPIRRSRRRRPHGEGAAAARGDPRETGSEPEHPIPPARPTRRPAARSPGSSKPSSRGMTRRSKSTGISGPASSGSSS